MPVCGGVEAYNEQSLHVNFYSQGVQTSFYESTSSASDSLGNTIPLRVTEDSGNGRANIINASEERNLRNIFRHSRVLFKCIPGTQGVWRVATSYRLKTTEPPHRHSSLSPVSGASITLHGSGPGDFPPNIQLQGSGDNSKRMPNILPENFIVHRGVQIHVITQLGSTSTTSGCGPPMLLSIPPRPAVTTGLYLKQQVLPPARI